MDTDSHKTPPLTLTTPDHSERKHLIAAREFPFKRFPFPIPPPRAMSSFSFRRETGPKGNDIPGRWGGRRAGKGDALKMQISSSRASF